MIRARRALVLSTLALCLFCHAPAGAIERHGTLPSVSPDGRWIAYVAEHDSGISELRVIGVDGKHDAQVVRFATGNVSPAWAPGGKRIVFALSRGGVEIESIRPDGAEPRRIVMVMGKSARVSRRMPAASPTRSDRGLAIA